MTSILVIPSSWSASNGIAGIYNFFTFRQVYRRFGPWDRKNLLFHLIYVIIAKPNKRFHTVVSQLPLLVSYHLFAIQFPSDRKASSNDDPLFAFWNPRGLQIGSDKRFRLGWVRGVGRGVVAERPSCSGLTSALTSGLPGTTSLPPPPLSQSSAERLQPGGPTTSPATLDLPGTNLTPPPPFSAVWPFVTQSLSSHQSWRSNTQCPKLELVSLVGRYSSALAIGNRPRNRVGVE